MSLPAPKVLIHAWRRKRSPVGRRGANARSSRDAALSSTPFALVAAPFNLVDRIYRPGKGRNNGASEIKFGRCL